MQNRTLVVKLDRGRLANVEWEGDTCKRALKPTAECACLEGVCSTRCDGASKCDVKIYVGFTGTDKNGKILTSASMSKSMRQTQLMFVGLSISKFQLFI